jgi:hypothetical protein
MSYFVAWFLNKKDNSITFSVFRGNGIINCELKSNANKYKVTGILYTKPFIII